MSPTLRPPTASSNIGEQSLDSSRKIYRLIKPVIHPWQEELWVLALSSELHLILKQMLFRGTAASCTVHPRDIFRVLILANASSFAIAHNHPSGNCTPSKEDIAITQQLAELGRMMQIPLVDHVILGDGRYYSFADAGALTTASKRMGLTGTSRRSPRKSDV